MNTETGISETSTSSSEELHAKPSQSQDCGADSRTHEEASQSPSCRSQTSSTQSTSSGRTCQGYSAQRTTHSDAFWERLPAKIVKFDRQGENGRTLVVCMDPKEQSRGDASMPNISTWHNGASVCSLSAVLETGQIPQRFFLSGRACRGILSRAERRGKKLPPTLESALREVSTKDPETKEPE